MMRIPVALPIGITLAALLVWLLPAPLAAQTTEELREQLARLQSQVEGPATGQEIYQAACATCHGLNGNGFGPESDGFAQHATIFTAGTYKLRSTMGQVPAPGDLERTIRVGMPGTEMVPFKHVLSEESIAAVAAYIRGFSPDLSDPEAVPDPDDIVEIPEERPFPRSEQSVAAGKRVWEEFDCGDCHGAQGRGFADEEDEWGHRVVMISFQEGYYKSGPTDQDLYRSIRTGMLGTTMEGYAEDLSEQQTWQLVDYIRSLGPEGQGFIGGLFGYFFSDRPSGFDYSNY